ncbi:MAG: hypothetical protein U0570_09945 [Phycisphaerales bacterium]
MGNRRGRRGRGRGGHPQGGHAHGRYEGHGSGGWGGGAATAMRPGPVTFPGLELPPGLQRIKPFEELTSIDPAPRLTLEYPGCPASCRLIDLFCPIGRGQRGLIVSPPKAGKTTLLKDIATAILRNHADVELVVLLVDERPEEVTDFRRTFAQYLTEQNEIARRAAEATGELLKELPPDVAAQLQPPANGQHADVPQASAPSPAPITVSPRVRVVASSNDHPIEKHVQVALATQAYCKALVEAGRHVVVVMDSLTRLGRAFNNSRHHASSGRTMTGGLDSKALEIPRQIFGASRNTEEAGSLTMIASCLVDTGSAADQVIFEEFKGSGNMELILDRKIAERRLFPAINLAASGTRKEHLLMGETEMKTMTALRRRLLAMPPHQQVEQLLAALQRFPTNAALVGSAG